MGTITPRQRADGSIGYTAQVRIKRGGKVVHSEAQTFERRQVAVAWLKRREVALGEPGALDALKRLDPPLRDAIQRYTDESRRAVGRTKAQVLRTIAASDLGAMRCGAIGSTDLVAFVRSLSVTPATAGNYLSHLASVFAIARPAWGIPLDQQAMRDASAVTRRLGLIGRSRQRDRRPTLDELNRLLEHFVERRTRRPDMAPMAPIILFALFSTRRLEEITRIRWADLDAAGPRVLVRDMKNPGEKIGNDVWVELPPEALRVVEEMPRVAERIFPHSIDAIGAGFTRAARLLGIENLHFHDLRHEGVSRLFEMGRTIPQVAAVSGHRAWQSLQRYTHLRQVGDKYEGWPWLSRLIHSG